MTPAIDITASQRKTLLAILRRYIPGVLVWAYGSRVKFTARPNSDLDLVVFTSPIQTLAVSNLKDDLAESNLPFLVDLHVWDEVPEKFHEIIRKEYVVVQEQQDFVLPHNWRKMSLEDSMAAIIDYRGKTPEKTTFGVPLVTAKIVKGGRIEKPEEFIAEADFDDWMRRGMPKPGDIVMTTEAPLGEVAQLDGRKIALAQRVITLRGKPDLLDNTFLKFLLQSNPVQEELRSRSTGTTVVGIRQSELRKVSLTLPPLAEQKAIAAVLGALDDKIELNRRMNATLEAMARALFQSWFVDFDPVRAKLDGRPPATLDPATAALFPDSFQDSKLGPIPKGWHVRSISCVVEEVFDGPHATPPDADEGPVFLGIKNLTGSAIDLTDIRHISESDWPRWTKRVTPRHLDIVFSYEATLGFFGLIPPRLRCCLGRRLALIRPKAKEGHPHFWFHQFIGTDFQRYLIQHSVQGATVDRIPLIQFPNYLVLDPPVAIKNAFENRVASLWAKIHTNAEQSRTLSTLRDTLLPKLLCGELSVASLETKLEVT